MKQEKPRLSEKQKQKIQDALENCAVKRDPRKHTVDDIVYPIVEHILFQLFENFYVNEDDHPKTVELIKEKIVQNFGCR